MDFGLTPEQEALRQEVCAFIAEHVTPEVVAEMEGHNEGLLGVTLGTETIAQMLGPYAQLLNGSPRAIEKGIFEKPLVTLAKDRQSEVVFHNVRVPGTSLVGELNRGAPIIERLLDHPGRVVLGQPLPGVAQA